MPSLKLTHAAVLLGVAVCCAVAAVNPPAACSMPVVATAGDTCDSMAAAHGLSVEQFLSDNPDLMNCRLVAGHTYCIGVDSSNLPSDRNDTMPTADGSCGADVGYSCAGASFGDCCSQSGYCGSGADYCGQGCQAAYGACEPASEITTSETPIQETPAPETPTAESPAPTAPASTCEGQETITITVMTISYDTVYITSVPTDVDALPTVTITVMTISYDTVYVTTVATDADALPTITITVMTISYDTFTTTDTVTDTATVTELTISYEGGTATETQTVTVTASPPADATPTANPVLPAGHKCEKFHFVRDAADTCSNIISTYAITMEQLNEWNPNLQCESQDSLEGYYLCVQAN